MGIEMERGKETEKEKKRISIRNKVLGPYIGSRAEPVREFFSSDQDSEKDSRRFCEFRSTQSRLRMKTKLNSDNNI